jgi:DNA-binding response OmpR family regulator
MTGTRRILVVEDDADIRETIEMALSGSGYDVVTTSHGADALAVLDEVSIDAILLDVRMPVMDGVEFARRMRARPGPRPPLALLTAAQDQKVARQIGAGWILEKPFDLGMLLEVVGEMTAPV